MEFIDDKHKDFTYRCLERCGDGRNYSKDCEYVSLFYTLGLTRDCREHIDNLFDFESRCVKWAALTEPWVSGADARVIRLAFNLFTGTEYEIALMDEAGMSKDKLLETYHLFSPVKLFSYGGDITRFMTMALLLRFNICEL